MYLHLSHTRLDTYHLARKLVKECYRLSKLLPGSERFGLVQQIRRAATSVSLNIAEGSARRTKKEKSRFYEMSRSSLVEIDAILDICFDLEYCTKEQMDPVGEFLSRCFKTLTGLIQSNTV